MAMKNKTWKARDEPKETHHGRHRKNNKRRKYNGTSAGEKRKKLEKPKKENTKDNWNTWGYKLNITRSSKISTLITN